MAKNNFKSFFQKIFKRVIAVILVLALLPSNLLLSYAETSNYSDYTKVGGTHGFGNYSQDLYIYNSLYYLDHAGNVVIGNGVGFALWDENDHGTNVYIGDNYDATRPNTSPNDAQINVCLDALTMTGKIDINPVNAGTNFVDMGVASASVVGSIVLNEGAELNLCVHEDFTLDSLVLGDDSLLTVEVDSGATFDIGEISGTGRIELSGRGDFAVDKAEVGSFTADNASVYVTNSFHSAGDIVLENVNINGNNVATLTAQGEIYVSDGTVSSLALFGYDASVVGEKKITLSSRTEITGVAKFGIVETAENATLIIEGLESVSAVSGTQFVSDFAIAYFHNADVLDYTPTAYRAGYTGKTRDLTEIYGTLVDSSFSSGTLLPEYIEAGYTFSGWSVNGSEDLYKDLVVNSTPIITIAESLSLNTSVVAGEVGVTFDHGFVPDEYSHVCSKDHASADKKEWYLTDADITVGSKISLDYPMARFGYKFDGWLITTGVGTTKIMSDVKSYTIVYSDLDDNGGSKTLRIEAQWTVDSYPLRLSLAGITTDLENIEISFDEGATWVAIPQITSAEGYGTKFRWDAEDKYISFYSEISYGESLDEFFTRIGLHMPILRDTRDVTVAQAFAAWQTVNGKAVWEESVFEYSESGFLDTRKPEQNLSQFDDAIKANPTTLISAWGEMQFNLTVDKVSGWELLCDGVVQTNYDLSLKSGTKVVLRTTVDNVATATNWFLKSYNSDNLKLYFEPYSKGEQYVNFSFTMPKCDVEAKITNLDDYYWDLAKSPITFENGVVFNNISFDGFWYNYLQPDLTPMFALVNDGEYKAVANVTESDVVYNYFYAWNMNNFYVTSYNVATQNQLTLISGMNVYLKECNLVATDAFKRDAVGTKFKGYTMVTSSNVDAAAKSLTNVDMSDTGNIVLTNDFVSTYHAKLYIQGENTVNAIVQKKFAYLNDKCINLDIRTEPANSTLNLGAIIGNFKTSFYSVVVNEITDNGFDLMIVHYNSTLNVAFSRFHETTNVNAPNKKMIVSLGSITLYDKATVEIGSVDIGYNLVLYNDSYIRIRGDFLSTYFGFNMYGNSSAVVDGNLLTTSWWFANNNTINTTGYLVLKGKIFRAGHLTLINGTIVANTIEVCFKLNISGGRIIANQIVNPIRTSGLQATSYASRIRTSASDLVPYETYASSGRNSVPYSEYNFENCEVFLFGYYELDSNNRYDFLGEWSTNENPMTEIYAKVIDSATGDLKSEINLDKKELIEKIKNQTNVNSECVAFGDSDEDEGAGYANTNIVQIRKNAEFYAAGNLTFFNRTIIGDAVVYANGKLRSNRDLFIEGNADVTAKAISSGYSLASKDDDNTYRWQQVVISGGNIKTDSLGADDGTMTTVVFNGNSVISPLTTSQVVIYNDTRVNYIYDSEFQVPALTQNYGTIRAEGVHNNGFSSMTSIPYTFPSVQAGTLTAQWALNSLTGDVVTSVNSSAVVNDSASTIVYMLPKVNLFAVKSEYDLVVKDGLDKILSIRENNTQLALSENVSVTKGATVELALSDKSMTKKTVIWYYDANGILHNVIPEFFEEYGIVSFVMPASKVEVFVANQIELDLYKYPVTLIADGFAIEEVTPDNRTNVREDAFFVYEGDVLISQSNIEKIVPSKAALSSGSYAHSAIFDVTVKPGYSVAKTENRILVLENPNFARTVILERIFQELLPNIYGIYIYDGADGDFKISGGVTLQAVGSENPQASVLTMSGLHNNNISKSTVIDDINNIIDGLNIISYTRSYTSASFNVNKVILNNMLLTKFQNSAFYNLAYSGASFTINNVYMNASNYEYPFFVGCNLTFNNSAVHLKTVTSNSIPMFQSCKEVAVTDSYVSYSFGGTVKGGAPIGSAVKMTLVNSEWNASFNRNALSHMEALPYYIPDELILTGTSSINSDYRLQLKKVSLYNNSSINVNKVAGYATDTYLICDDINMYENSQINAGYVIVSAFTKSSVASHTASNYLNFVSWIENNTNLVKTGTLNMYGGTINSKFVGGAYGATLNLNGGAVNAQELGTLKYIFGYTANNVSADEEMVHRYEIAPSGLNSVINIAGATVNIAENGYLGGQNSEINVTGGNVNLANGAVLGLTDEQCVEAENDATSHGKLPADAITTNVVITGGKIEGLNAQILTPYNSVQISGADTAVKIGDIVAEKGTITILEAKGTYDITNRTDYENPPLVGVCVDNQLTAQAIVVKDGATVYAKDILAVIPEDATFGGFRVEGEGTAVYTDSYGVSGAGATDESIDIIEYGPEQNVFCLVRVVPLTYVLNGDDYDPAYNSPDNPDFYRQHPTEYLELAEPTRHGFDFAGWYLTPDFSGERAYRLQKSYINPVTLYAKWTPKKVTFQVVLDSTAGIDVETATADASAELGTFDGEKFVYKTVTLDYRTSLQGGTGIRLENYNLPMYQILTLQVNDSRYEGSTNLITTETIIDRDIFDAYTKDTSQPFMLRVKDVQKAREKIVFNLNISNGLPLGATFSTDSTEIVTSVTRESWVDYGSKISSGVGLMTDGEFISASAPGYKFVAWKAEDGDIADESVVLEKGVATIYYAEWLAKEYHVVFDSVYPDGKVTYTSAEPTDDSANKLNGIVTYDELINGGIYWDDTMQNAQLPTSWHGGYKFSHWQVGSTKIGAQTKLNLTDLGIDLDEEAGDTADVGLTISAVYTPVTVTYNTNGGKWNVDTYGGEIGKDTTVTHQAVWGEPLAGYTKDVVHGTDHETISEKTEYGNTYAIYSTTGEYYNANEQYVSNDYRSIITKKGYTFYGWFTEQDSATAAANGDGTYIQNVAVTTPQYDDITVYAAWSANEYDLRLNARDTEKTYSYTKFSNDYILEDGAAQEGEAPKVHVVVEKVLSTGEIVDVENWPERLENNDWYAYNAEVDNPTEDSDKRFLLGFTFAPLDPGSSYGADSSPGRTAYLKYASQVTQLINAKVLLVKNQSEFFIPDHYDYGDVRSIADYPSGSTIDMYAVYRERSLVFIEYYKDIDGTTKELEKAAFPYQDFVDYPDIYENEDSKFEIERNGYSLIGWYLYEPNAQAANKYPDTQDVYDKNLSTYLETSKQNGSYDIKVYTVYAAKVYKNGVILTGDGKSTGTERSDYSEYTMPGSMQTGKMSYEIVGAGVENINFVTRQELEDNRYTTSIPGAGTSDNTVALVVTLTSPDGKVSHTADITELSGTFGKTVVTSAGWTIRLDLYTSKVVTDDEAFVFDLVFGFVDESLKDQQITFKDMKIQMTPSAYIVNYDSNLPEIDNLVVDGNGFSQENQVISAVVNYGANFLDKVPVVEGYSNDGMWHQTISGVRNGQVRDFGGKFDLPVSDDDNGTIYLEMDWDVVNYKLNVEPEILQYWNVVYTIAGQSATNYTDEVEIPYRTPIDFVMKSGVTTYDEFVRLDYTTPGTNFATIEETTSLLQTGRSIEMQARDLHVIFERVRTLFLEDDNITIFEDTYDHKGETVVWHGDYVILMDKDNNIDGSSTNNVLTLNENLSGRNIDLKNLKITSDNSIALTEGTTVELNVNSSTVEAKNIAVPSTAQLTLVGDENNKVILNPSASNSAIGGTGNAQDSGIINLKNLSIDMTMLAGSSASGIGPANNTAVGNSINIDECDIQAGQTETPLAKYNGSWLGGEGVSLLTIENSTLSQKATSANPVDSYAVNAKNVTIENCGIGTFGAVGGSIYAENVLRVSNSTVEQSIKTTVVRAPIGTSTGDGAGIQIVNSTVNVESANGSWPNITDGILYSGKMHINDAQSVVTINATRLLEVGNGDINITATGHTQNGNTASHSGKYALLGNKNIASEKLTVNGDADIRLDPLSNHVGLEEISYNGNLVFTGANNVYLNVGDFKGIGNLTLNDIMVNSTGSVGSLGSAVDSTVPSNVIVTGNSNITANTVGALGEYNKTFTFLKVEGNNVALTGNVVQDHYRIEYVTEYDVSNLYTIFRTENLNGTGETAVGGSVPDAPNDAVDFRVWYYKADDKIYALSTDAETVPGFDENAVLSSNLPENVDKVINEDGTFTLLLYADAKIEGTVILAEDRLFTAEGVTNNRCDVSIPANGAFTALLTAKGANMTGGQYSFGFTNALPANTKLTLVVLKDNVPTYYYYNTVGGETTILASSFVRMGDGTVAQLPDSAEMSPTNVDVLLLAFDFEYANASAGKNTVTFNFVSGTYTPEIVNFEYILTTVDNGKVSATMDSTEANKGNVTVVHPSNSVYDSEQYDLVAEITGVNVPYNATAILGEMSGVLFDGNKFRFENISTGTQDFEFSGVYGEYTVKWSLVLNEGDNNVLGILLAQSNEITLNETKSELWLELAVQSIVDSDGNYLSNETRTFEQGKTYTVSYTYKTNSNNVYAITEEQNNILNSFDACGIEVNKGPIMNYDGITSVTLTVTYSSELEQGVYRLAVSLDGNSFDDYDNAYCSFVVH